jgi:Peptidase C13 family
VASQQTAADVTAPSVPQVPSPLGRLPDHKLLLGLFLPVQQGARSPSTAPRSTSWTFDYIARCATMAESLGFWTRSRSSPTNNRMGRTARCCFQAAVVGLTLASASLAGCAEPQVALLAQQQQAADTPEKVSRLFYIGLGLYSEPWSENDVVELADMLQHASQYRVVPMIASNVTSAARHYPIADDATIMTLVSSAATQAGPDDIVFVDISSHGASRILARKVGSHAPTALSSRELARKLESLAGHRTVIIISACYSGSLIGDLRAPERIIVTAARADRSSFGCAPDSRHTFFGEAELHAFGLRDRSLHQVFASIRDDVARMESGKRYQPSEPQIWVGPSMTDLYDAPLF